MATRNNFNVHDISVQDLSGRLHVEQHLELDEQLSLKEAHDQVTRLESDIRNDVPEISGVVFLVFCVDAAGDLWMRGYDKRLVVWRNGHRS